MQEGSTGASSASEETLNAIQRFDEISNAVNVIFDLNTSIASASQEQNAISNSISKSISEINEISKETLSYSNKTRESSSEIGAVASDLKALISGYQL